MDKRISFPISEDEHRKLKMLAAKEGKTIKELLLECLDFKFPDWKNKEN